MTGLVFLGITVVWALRASGVVGGVDPAIAVPVVLVAAGVVGLAAMVVGRRRAGSDRRLDHTETTDTTDTKEMDR